MRYVVRTPWKGLLLRGIDLVGAALVPRRAGRRPPRRIVVGPVDSLGDGVMALPALRALAARFPRARIEALVRPVVAELLRVTLPDVRSVRRVARGCDLAIDLRGHMRSILRFAAAGVPEIWGRDGAGGGFMLSRTVRDAYRRHEIEDFLALVDDGAPVKFPPVTLDSSASRAADRMLAHARGRGIVAIHAGAGRPEKRWPAENFARVARRIEEEGRAAVLVGSRSDPGGGVDLTGRTTLPELMAVLSRAEVLLGNDSGPAHVAALLDRPVVVLFGRTARPERWAPWGPTVRVVRHPRNACRRLDCMDHIDVEEVLRAVRGV